jgi:superfamily II DNA or RNA helicase
MSATFTSGTLVAARGREWVVLPESTPEFYILRPLGGGDDDTAGVFPGEITPASFALPTAADLGDADSASLLRTALRLGFRSTAGPFRSLAHLAVEPRAYQFVPLMVALKQDVTRLLIADDVGIGKTIEASLIAAELLATGTVRRLAVLCSPALAEQWQSELRTKFGIDAELVLPSTVSRLSRDVLMTESLFDHYPFVVVSTDFIKSHTRRREFLNHCPELVIVDEAHGAVADGNGRGRTLRYDLLKDLAADRARHLILVTATPHSGKEEGFRNLVGLLDPELATLDLAQPKGRELLARHFVQRRRGDIRKFLNEETVLPSDRQSREVDYGLTKPYAALFDDVLDYARTQVTEMSVGQVQQRVRWWSALALLRALSSSPRAAAATLRTRAAAAGAETVELADELGRASVLDQVADDATDAIDAIPGADPEASDIDHPSGSAGVTHRRKLLAFAKRAMELEGKTHDAKLVALIGQVKALLADGYDPIVFCRFIDTADYVATYLNEALGKNHTVRHITGALPPDERVRRLRELTDMPGRHVLVATDCLSEGVNLQEHFQAVIHYDLAWNPTRHEQREGRVDRFGQPRDVVRAVTIYGRDNAIDGIVLNVLIRKHKAIREATGVSVPVPDESNSVVEALMEGLLLRGKNAQQLTLDLGMEAHRAHLHDAWDSAADREKQSQTKYAQGGIHPDEVYREVTAARAALGSHGEVERFTKLALKGLGATISDTRQGFTANTSIVPIGLRDSLPTTQPLAFQRDLPAPRGTAVLARTDPQVETVARFVLDLALDGSGPDRPAARAGVMRTTAVTQRTTLLVIRFRFHLTLPGKRELVVEDARSFAFTGTTADASWLSAEAVTALEDSAATGNIPSDQATTMFERILAGVPGVLGHLDGVADGLAAELAQAHSRVRTAARSGIGGISAKAERPVDILGVYLYLPEVTA